MAGKYRRSYAEILSCRNPFMAAAELVLFLWSCTAERSWKTEPFFQIEKRLCKQRSFRCSVHNCGLPSRWGEGKKDADFVSSLQGPASSRSIGLHSVFGVTCRSQFRCPVCCFSSFFFFFPWIKTSNGQCKWEGKILEILFFRSMCRGLGALLSFGPSSVDGEKQQSKKSDDRRVCNRLRKGWHK